jgi:predicted anti-sigma-YlaC factor YlaD
MNCNEVRENLIDLLAEGPSVPGVREHVKQCSACAKELDGLRKTMSLLDEWQAPEPSPYFLSRVRAHAREEREKQPSAAWLAWLRRPVLAGTLAAILVASGVFYFERGVPPVAQEPGTAVSDLESLDKNHDVLVKTDLIDEMTLAESEDVSE